MKRMAWLWMIFILVLLWGSLGCSKKEILLKDDKKTYTQKETLAKPANVDSIQKGNSEISKKENPVVSQEKSSGVSPQPLPSNQGPAPIRPAPPSPVAPSVTPAPPPAPQTSPIPVAPQAPIPAKTVAPGSGVVFNFDNADIYEVIRVIAEVMKITYIIDPKVKGVVNIHTSGQIPSEEVFNIFQLILRLNGATAVKKENLYEIVPLGEAKKLSIPPSTARDSSRVPTEEKYTIQIISLKFIPVTEVSKMIKPFLSDGADIVEYSPHNILIIGDVASNVKKSLDIINLFDIDIFVDLRVRVYPILNADVNEVAKEMERIFSSFEISTKSGRGVGITFTPVTRINSLLVVSSIPNIFEKVEGWLNELDKIPAAGSKLSVFVYYVQNAKAKDLADVLKEVFSKVKEKTEKAAAPAETQRGVKPSPSPPTAPSTAKEGEAAVPEGEINIVVDEATNSLIIKAFERDYKNILETIKRLDIYPKQVLIEVLLAEITLDDSNKFGIEWSKFLTHGVPEDKAQEIVIGAQPPLDPFSQALTGTGIRYSIVELGGRISAAINAAASTDRLNIISSPHIIASNNKEAKIQIGSSQPILTNTYTTTATGTPGVVEGTIEYKDIGVILTVTPRISDGGLITLEIQIEKSDVNTQSLPLGNLTNVPVFTKKTAKTILSVLQGQMIIIGGFIEDSRSKNKSGIPLLHKIPILGGLFGSQQYDNSKTELILLMTPHIITDHIQSRSVTDEFKEKVEGLKKEMERFEKKR